MLKLFTNLLVALIAAFGIHLLIIATMGSFYDVSEIKEILGGNTTHPIFLPTLAICFVYAIYLTYKKIQS